MALHPFRRFAATGGTSASIRIWTAATRPAGADEDESGALGEWCEVADLSRERDAHSDMVLALEFLDAARAPPELPREGGDPAAWGNGRVWLASAGADRSIRVWSGPLDMSKSVVHPGNVGGAGGGGDEAAGGADDSQEALLRAREACPAPAPRPPPDPGRPRRAEEAARGADSPARGAAGAEAAVGPGAGAPPPPPYRSPYASPYRTPSHPPLQVLVDGAPPPRTKWTRRVPRPVLSGHAASLTPY